VSGPWDTALGVQAKRIESELGSFVKAARRLAALGATDVEIRELYYPRCNAIERRLLDLEIADARDARSPATQAEWYARVDEVHGQAKHERTPWRNVETWAETDFRAAVAKDREGGGSGSYRSVAKRVAGWGATALLRRWQKVSGGKPWPSGRKRTDAPG
jgi:hypothetical protein